MSTSFTQENRALSVTTPLGKDVLLLASFSGSEQISGLFHFDLEMWSENDAIAAADIVGKYVTFQVASGDGSLRYFHGIVCRFSAGVRRDVLRFYRAEVVPWLWLLTRTTDCKIFQNQTVPEIIEAVFGEYGLSDYKTDGISAAHPKLEYCVQYRETDFDFLSRLMQAAGIFYYFEFADGKHTLVLADSNATFQDCPQNEVEYTYLTSRQVHVNRITGWEHRYEYRSGKWSQTDYNFIDHPAGTAKTPAKHLLTDSATTLSLDSIDKYEQYDFPGGYQKKPDGAAYTKVRIEEDEAPHHIVYGSGRCCAFVPGTKFKITKHDCEGENDKTYILTSVTHVAREGAPYRLSVSADEAIEDYDNQFTCIPVETTYRPPRVTPKPMIRGTQTAVVVGPSGEEIWPDKYGRVKVQFFWDRDGVRDENSSCWVRVAQAMAGKGWGNMFIPRVGQEVVVTYLEGDPDRPLITGLVYNADQMPPYALPDEKTKSYIKTNSSNGGEGYNEIRFEDLKDEEQIFIHAQKNLDMRVLNDTMEHVINDRHLIVGQDGEGSQFEQVQKDKHLNVKGDQVELIEGKVQWTAGGDVELLLESKKTETIAGDHEFHLQGEQKQLIDGDQSLEVGGAQNVKVTGQVSLDIGDSLHEKISAGAAIEAGADLYLKGGANVVIEAGTQLTLKVGGNFVVVSSAGVDIKGSMINLNGGGSAGSGSAPSPTAPVAPADAAKAEPTEPTDADDSTSGVKSAPDSLG